MHKLKIIRIRDNRLSLNARLVYSYLVYRARKQAGATPTKIATALRMNQTKVIKPTLLELLDLDWVEIKEGVYRAKPPAEHLVFWRGNRKWEKDWTKQLGFWMAPVPEKKSGVTWVQAAMLGFLNSKYKAFKKTTGYSYMGKVLNITKYVAKYNMEKLLELQCCRIQERKKNGTFIVEPVFLTEAAKRLFRQKKETEKTVEEPTKTFDQRLLTTLVEEDRLTKSQAYKVLDWGNNINFFQRIDKVRETAIEVNIKNITEGKWKGDVANYSRIFWTMLLRVAKDTHVISDNDHEQLLNFR